jgi:hypothetical protein
MMKWTVARMLGFALTSLGLTGSLATAQTTLVSTGSVWRYLDTGVDQGAAWQTTAFDDSSWASGAAQLGFSNGEEKDETTLLSPTNALGEKNITFYFRLTFNVPDAGAYSNLLVRLQRDDGAVVYLNGVEVFRSNMPEGVIAYSTLAFLAQDDGAGIFARPIDRSLLISGDNLLAVEVHQSSATSSDISFDLELAADVTFEPPTVNITSPSNGAVIGSPTVILTTAVGDVDGVVTMVEFFEGGNLLGIATDQPFSFIHSGLIPGTYSFTAVAIDSTGVNATSAPVVITVVPWLVPSHAEWRYLDDGSEPGTAWIAPGFSDSGWSNGVAQLGFGEGDEATTIRKFDLTGTNQIAAYYFRHAFDVPDPPAIRLLSLRLLRDDGAIVYLNGAEIFRSNMPTGAVNSTTLAAQVAAEDNTFRATRVNPGLLRPGKNVLAVEVHQANLTSSDVSFDLELLPDLAPRQPVIVLTDPVDNPGLFGPTNVTLTAVASDVDDAVASVGFYVDGWLTGSSAGEPYSLTASNLLGNHTIFAVATDSTGLSSTSAPVNLGIARVIPLVPTGAVWKYLDTGVDQGTGWRAASFDDSGWSSGPGKLGTNDPSATVIHIRGPGGIIPTCYFRHSFVATDLSRLTNLAFRVLRDDGCIAYLNGVEIFRMNITNSPVTFNYYVPLLQAVGGNDEANYYPTNISPALLVSGNNVLAVELHQTSNTSDAGFDLGLTGIAIPPVNVPPLNIQHTPPGVLITWPGSGFILQESSRPDGPYTNRPTITSPYNISTPTGNRFFRLFRP